MTAFRKSLLAAAAFTSLMATAAGAAVIVDPAPWPGGGADAYTGPTGFLQVHSSDSQPAGSTILGEVKNPPSGPGDGTSVSFHSTASDMYVFGSGHAYIKDVIDSNPLSNLSIFLTSDPNGFTAIEFNLEASGITGPDGVPVWAFMSVDFLGSGSANLGSFNLANGENKFRIYGDAGEVFSRVNFNLFDANSMTANARGLDGIKQVDLILGPGAPIPEPASWAMMIAGFGLIGAAMRRRKVETVLA